jgi:hypothetical protein
VTKGLLILVLLILAAARGFGQGGPPLLTDDPDPPGNNHWEINVAATLQASTGYQLYEVPHIDLNYGLGDSLQLKWETGLAAGGGSLGTLQFGWEDSLFGIKWRILDGGEHGLTVGTYPQLGTRLLSSDNETLAGGPSTYALLPVEVKYGMGEFAVDAEVGALLAVGENSGWMYGICAGYNITKAIELLTEFHGTTGNPIFFPPGLVFQVGTHTSFNDIIALIASVGTTVVVPAGTSNTFLLFLGTQLTL